MRYKSFRIKNFKGIKDTTIDLNSQGASSVFAFVGLNESGKTTILEAIHTFSPDKATSELVGGSEGTGVPYAKRVPRQQYSSFTGDVSVSATLELTEHDKEELIKQIRTDTKLIVESLPAEISFERHQRFKGGDYQANHFSLRTKIRVKTLKQKQFRDASFSEIEQLKSIIYSKTPDISYFPTFVFEFPETFFLTERGSARDKFYASVFQDILDFDGRNHTIEDDIIRRVRGRDLVIPWLQFLSLWPQRDDLGKIQHVLDRASAIVTKVVFGRWNKIFKEDTKGKEVTLVPQIVEGEVVDANGTKQKTHEHDVAVRFEIKDGTRRFKVNDRSLGFRWFFAFMLFTQFRVARADTRPVLFLFDEPASNLHAAAQQKLVECFPEIAKDEHALIYTTHSHYMIEPKWLEQTFIVTNRADAPNESMLDAVSLDDESLDIKATRYRSFVNANPNQTSYFQPIIDRLQVVPSRFDLQRASIIVEGKSDYYILRYIANLHGQRELPLIPGLGAGTLGALVSLHLGWGLRYLFVFDGDGKGKEERKRYAEEFGLNLERAITIDQLVTGLTVIEDLLDDKAREAITAAHGLAHKPTKNQIRRFFQESLAADKIVSLSPEFEVSSRQLLDALVLRFR